MLGLMVETLEPIEDVIPTECGCGCGTPINALNVRAVRLRREGLTIVKVAETLGINPAHVKMLSRQFSRYAVGHSTPRRPWETRACKFCGQDYKIPESSTRAWCRNCPALTEKERTHLHTVAFDEREARKNSEMRASRVRLVGGMQPLAQGIPSRVAEMRAVGDRLIENLPRRRIPQPKEPVAVTVEVRALHAEYYERRTLGIPQSWDTLVGHRVYNRLWGWAKRGWSTTEATHGGNGRQRRKIDAVSKAAAAEFATQSTRVLDTSEEDELRALIEDQIVDARTFKVSYAASLDALSENGVDPAYVDREEDMDWYDAARHRKGVAHSDW